MNAKTYDSKTAAFAGYLIQNVPPLTDEEMNGWMDNPRATKKFLSDLKPPEMAPAKPTPLLFVIATTNLGAVARKKTEQCFTGSRYAYRDGDFDNWIPANQPNADACVITTLAPSKGWTFAEAAVAVLGIGASTDVVLLGNLLIQHGHTMTLAQAEEMVEKTERDEKTGMRTDGYANFFFVETGDEKNPVSVAHVSRDDSRWSAYVFRLVRGYRCYAARRLLVRNLSDASKL